MVSEARQSTHPGNSRRVGCAGIVVVLLWAFGNASARGQTWEYSPYDIRVWLAVDDTQELTDNTARAIERAVAHRGRILAGATWKVTVSPAPPELATDMARSPELLSLDNVNRLLRRAAFQAADADGDAALTPEEAKSQAVFQRVFAPQDTDQDGRVSRDEMETYFAKNGVGELLPGDKIFLVGVTSDWFEFRVNIRELDVPTRQLGRVVELRHRQRSAIAGLVVEGLARAFSPLVRIEEVDGRDASARVRAGGLVIQDHCPSRVTVGHTLLPIIRRNDRLGYPKVNGIQAAEWTYLLVMEQSGSLIKCKIHTGLRSPLGGRSSRRTEKLALGVRAVSDATQLELQSRGENPAPLAGYDIYAKDPLTEESEFVGQSDWRGVVGIPRTDQPLRLLYVKNGGQLLARLPMIPGWLPRETAQIQDDDKRLLAESFVRGMETTLMDLVAERQVLAKDIRTAVKEGRLDDAQKLVEQFRELRSQLELRTMLDQEKQSVFSENPRIQAHIDKLFSTTQELVVKYIDPGTVDKLATEVAGARRGEGE